jgi:8-oxo-dGTP pyrophosphatase MutT (NUDIX family)
MERSTIQLEALDLRFSPRPWAFADQQRERIGAYFAAQRQAKPQLWNGRVLLLSDHAVIGRTFRGDFFETDYASFLAWRDWGTPDQSVKNCFAMGAIKGSDNGFVLGVMGAETANAGKIYFPAGMTDLQALKGTSVDLEANMWREIEEETGLTRDDLAADAVWHTVFDGPRIAHIRLLHARETAQALRARILGNIRSQQQPELADIHIVRNRSDLNPMVQPVVVAFLNSTGI